jgi:hypothetical protein
MSKAPASTCRTLPSPDGGSEPPGERGRSVYEAVVDEGA